MFFLVSTYAGLARVSLLSEHGVQTRDGGKEGVGLEGRREQREIIDTHTSPGIPW